MTLLSEFVIFYYYKQNEGRKTMGKIIGEGITFDDVLLVPAYSPATALLRPVKCS